MLPASHSPGLAKPWRKLYWFHVQVSFAAIEQQFQPFQHPLKSPIRHLLLPCVNAVPRRKKRTGKSCQNIKVRSFLIENVPCEEANFDVKQIRKVIFIQDE